MFADANAALFRGSSDRYENLSVLGEGTFAVVWKARDKKTDEIVAIKKIKVTESPEAQNGLDHTALREIRLMQELCHDNVCRVC